VPATVTHVALAATRRLTVRTSVAPPPPSDTSWTYCSTTGAICDLIGLRDVRLNASNGTAALRKTLREYSVRGELRQRVLQEHPGSE